MLMSIISYQLRQEFFISAAQQNIISLALAQKPTLDGISLAALADNEMIDPSGVGFFVALEGMPQVNKPYSNKHGKPTLYLRRLLLKRQEGKCHDCGLPQYIQERAFDIHRKKKDGPYHPDNCIILCRKCHLLRHPRIPWSNVKRRWQEATNRNKGIFND